jgi:uncharacterized phage infection (PIP) family protein YhgE
MKTVQVVLDYEVDRVLESVADRLATRLFDELKRDITEKVTKTVTDAVETQINTIILDSLNRRFKPVNRFGDPVGEETSLSEIITSKSDSYLSEIVDSSGRKADHYSGSKQPRMNFILGQLVKESLDAKTTAEIKKLAESAKEKAMQQVAELIVKVVSK